MVDRNTQETPSTPGEPPRHDASGTAVVLGMVVGTLAGAAVGWMFGQTGAGIAGGAFGGVLIGLLAVWWTGRRRSRQARRHGGGDGQ